MKDIRTMIDKVIGKKGRLRVPAYWMNTLLGKIVELVESVRKELVERLGKVENKLPAVAIDREASTGDLIVSPGQTVFSDSLPRNAHITVNGTLYAFLPVNFINTTVAKTGLYRITGIQIGEFSLIDAHFLDSEHLWSRAQYYLGDIGEVTEETLITLIRSNSYGTNLLYKGKEFSSVIYASEVETDRESSFYVLIQGKKEYLYYFAFRGCSELYKIELSHGITEITVSMFQYCTQLRIVVLSDNITDIGSYAFSECPYLSGIYFYGNTSVPSLSSDAFQNSALPFIYVPEALIDDWKAHPDWAAYASRVYSI